MKKYYIFPLIVLTFSLLLGYITLGGKPQDSSFNQHKVIGDSISNTDVKNQRVYISKEELGQFLYSNYAISSYNTLSITLTVASLVVTLLGWFLWINIIDTKNIKTDLKNTEKEFIEKMFEEKSKIMRQISDDYEFVKKRYEYTSAFDAVLLEEISKLLKNKVDLKKVQNLYRSLYFSQIYYPDKDIRVNAIRMFSNYCEPKDTDSIEKLHDVLEKETDIDVKKAIKDAMSFINKKGEIKA